MFSKKFIIFQFIFVIAFVVLIVMRSTQAPKEKTLPVISAVSDFKLKHIDNSEIDLSQFKGNIWVANFMFTTCANICPIMTGNMAKLHEMYKLVDDVRLVSFTVNPEVDTPEILSAYANKYKADTKRWFFLTGTREQLTDVAVRSFKLGDIKEPIFHSPSFVLVDRSGNIRAYYDGTESSNIKRIAHDIRNLLMEK